MGGRWMRNLIFLTACLFLILFTFGQEIQHEVRAILIEVDVRVFKGNTFVDDLDVDDFELYEDGKLQEIEDVYLIKEKNIERELVNTKLKGDVIKPFTSIQKRNFVLMFEIVEYLPRVGDVIDYFFNNVILPDDLLIVTTPRKSYQFDEKSFEKLSKTEMAEQLKRKVRKDAVLSSAGYRNLIRDFKDLERTPFPKQADLKAQMLLELSRKLKGYMYIDKKKISQFTGYLRNIEGQKHVFFFYQKNLIPVPTGLSDADIFELFPDLSLNTDDIKEVFSDSSVTCHFLYIPQAPLTERGQEQSEFGGKWMDVRADIFRGFSEMADATGGLTVSSRNPEFSFKEAMEASGRYYLIYYVPKDYKSDGKFKNIEVKVKGKNYKVLHRAGYIAD